MLSPVQSSLSRSGYATRFDGHPGKREKLGNENGLPTRQSVRRPSRRAERFRKRGELPMEGLSRGGGLAISLHRGDRTVTDRQAGLTLGFLTVLHDAAGFTGGYLVTNAWGRPLEFRLTTPVQPNRVQ